ncbi:MAG TPA: IclR family transcriptional regulator [Rhodopila sp.]|uniref:IclR family transcriptional regulator n=1 Tax=Rhodopila sp. TaxID=2480087 RepID=UPI002C3A6521|nr:IclR family transcriptional regulator [Rhodopila sp.]HVY16992.1 IclR family transcriptional regulator [Rhodopila sp.]
MPQDVNANRQEAASSAPALDKGLDLLEVLANEPGGLTQKQVAERVGRSASEIFRMLGVLQRRGYIARDAESGAYSLTLRLFDLATRHPPTRRLQHAAQPVMDRLAAETGLCCHLSVLASETRFMSIATALAPNPMNWVVKLGASFPLTMPYTSARVLAAFQDDSRRASLVRALAEGSGVTAAAVTERLDAIRRTGYDIMPSEVAEGITDLSHPVPDAAGHALAALTLPFMPWCARTADAAATVPALISAAAEIARRLHG